MRDLSRRVERSEILDEGRGSDVETTRSLEDLRRLNRWLFGTAATLAPLQRWLRDHGGGTILDLGTGSGQMAQTLARWGRRQGIALQITGVDLMPRHLRVADRHRRATAPVALLAADARRLPLADQSVDYVISSLFVHHFDEAGVGALWRECRRVARRGVVMSDLWRHPLPYGLYKWVAEPLLVRSPITRVDSTASFERAYRPDEVRRLAAESLPAPTVRLHLPSFRWVLTSRW